MINGIILSNNLDVVKNVLNNLNIEILFKVATNEQSLENFTKEKSIDIILLDNDFNEISDIILDKYKTKTLTINNETDFTNEELISQISEITSANNEHNKRDKILNELQDLGYSLKHQGTYYLADIISEINKSQNFANNNLQKDIYPLIGKKQGKSAFNIKSSVHKATDCMYYECDVNKLQKYFCFYDDTKPTVKEVIMAVNNKISFS